MEFKWTIIGDEAVLLAYIGDIAFKMVRVELLCGRAHIKFSTLHGEKLTPGGSDHCSMDQSHLALDIDGRIKERYFGHHHDIPSISTSDLFTRGE